MKNKSIYFIFITIAGLAGLGLYGVENAEQKDYESSLSIPDEMKEITLYKDPYCGCCEGHAKALEDAGFIVNIINTPDNHQIKNEKNIPMELRSCHTTMIGDYIVEGHVPIEAIKKLIEEQPKTIGIALPGMPTGTPGMPGAKTEVYKIYNIDSKELFLKI